MVGADQKNVGLNCRLGGGYAGIRENGSRLTGVIPPRYGTHERAQRMILLPITEVRAAWPAAVKRLPIK
jgi:hypothetical protein